MQLLQLAVKMQRLTRKHFTDATIKPPCTISMCICRQISKEEEVQQEEEDASPPKCFAAGVLQSHSSLIS